MTARALLNLDMACSRCSELVVQAGAGNLNDEVAGTGERIGAAGPGDRSARTRAGEVREQILEPQRPMVGEGMFPAGTYDPTDQGFGRGCAAGAANGIGIAHRVVGVGEGDAAGDVGEVAISGDTESG